MTDWNNFRTWQQKELYTDVISTENVDENIKRENFFKM